MKNKKIGKLIFKLRKEKDLTQLELAKKLFLSDKTISKWERGKGCPDISNLNALANFFNVDIDKLILGDLEKNEKDGDNMKKIEFYNCKNCNNILTSLEKIESYCCGKKLKKLEAKKADKKHKLDISIVENDYFIKLSHPMTKDHYINFVAYVEYDSIKMKKMYPEQTPQLRFSRGFNGKIFFLCKKDGLFIQDI